MAYISPELFKDWQNRDMITAKDYSRERNILLAGINNLNAELRKLENTFKFLQEVSSLELRTDEPESDDLFDGRMWLRTDTGEVQVAIGGEVKTLQFKE